MLSWKTTRENAAPDNRSLCAATNKTPQMQVDVIGLKAINYNYQSGIQ